jgi:hypothetical protein
VFGSDIWLNELRHQKRLRRTSLTNHRCLATTCPFNNPSQLDPGAIIGDRCSRGAVVHVEPGPQRQRIGWRVGGKFPLEDRADTTTRTQTELPLGGAVIKSVWTPAIAMAKLDPMSVNVVPVAVWQNIRIAALPRCFIGAKRTLKERRHER